jgi:predicted secreted protein
MKKILTLLVIASISVSAFAQSKTKAIGTPNFEKTKQLHENNSKTGENFIYVEEEGYPIGNTFYDLQCNNASPDRLIRNANGSLSCVWTFAPDATANYPQRGTGYNHMTDASDIGTWGAMPTTRIEPSNRTGWPAIVSDATNEFFVAHPAATGYYGFKRPIGSGTWTAANVSAVEGYSWPRMTSSGSNYHLIGLYEPVTGEYQLHYFRSTDGGTTWDIQAFELPGYSAIYEDISEGYSIAAKGNTVVIVVFGFVSDVTMWKSLDNGNTWTATTILDFPVDQYDGAGGVIIDMDADAVADTVYSSDQSGDVVLDSEGNAHVTFSITKVEDSDALGDNYTYWPYIDGIMYWNESMGEGVYSAVTSASYIEPAVAAGVEVIGWSPDMDLNGVYNEYADVAAGSWPFGEHPFTSLSGYGNMSIDPANNIYLIYSSVIEGDDYVKTDATPNAQNYRHLIMRARSSATESWGDDFYLITPVDGTNAESLYPFVVSSVIPNSTDTLIHMAYQWDGEPGITLHGDEDAISEGYIIYKGIPAPLDATANSINETSKFQINVYPNPTTDFVNVTNAKGSIISVYNLIGQEVYSIESISDIQEVNVSNLPSGAYILRVANGNETISKQIMKY